MNRTASRLPRATASAAPVQAPMPAPIKPTNGSKDGRARTALFQRDRETDNTVIFKEVPARGEPNMIGRIYIQKWFALDAEAIAITVTTDVKGRP